MGAPPNPLRVEGLSYAVRGRKILRQRGCTKKLAWAKDIVTKLGD